MREGSLDVQLDLGGPHGVSGELTLQSCPLIYEEEAREHETFSRKVQLVLTPASAWSFLSSVSRCSY